jgi:membrane protease YdiL (CAAX protease family)
LLPKLLPRGQAWAIIVSGAVWGIWHAPAILMGHNYPDHRLLGVVLMVGFTILFGTLLSWVYLRTRSPCAPALGHASLNAVAGFPLLLIPNVDFAVGGALTSLIGWIPMAAFIGWLVWSRRLPVQMPEE